VVGPLSQSEINGLLEPIDLEKMGFGYRPDDLAWGAKSRALQRAYL